MSYNVWIDLALMGGAVTICWMLCARLNRPKRGATPEPDRHELRKHQAVRRIMTKDGLHK